jgi:hypothetical protein
MSICMRTTIRLEPNLLKQLKRLAIETHRTFTAVIEDAVRETLYRRAQVKTRKPIRLPTFKGTGLQPGVNLDNSAEVLDRMDGL